MKIELKPVRPADVDMLYQWFTAVENARVWRYRGATPDPEAFGTHLWAGTLAHFLCISESPRVPVCYVSIYDANLASGHAKMACISSPQHRKTGASTFGFIAGASYAFKHWPFERILLECNTYSVEGFASGIERGFLHEIARIPRYERFAMNDWADLIWLEYRREVHEKNAEAGYLGAWK